MTTHGLLAPGGLATQAATSFPDTVLYVDPVNGNDVNSGRLPGIGGAMATIAAAVSALPVTGGTLELAAGTHPWPSAIVTSKPLRLHGPGRGKTILLNTLASGYMLTVTGSKGAAIATTVDVIPGATTITDADASTLTPGVRVLMRSNKAWSSVEAVPMNGEIVRVKSIAANVLTLYDTVDESYAVADTTVVEKLNTVDGVRIEGVTFKQATPNTTTTQAIRLLYCLDPIVTDCEFIGLDSAAIQPETCPGFQVVNCHFQDLTDDVGNSRVGYGVNIGGASRDGRVRGCTFHNVRHAVTTNGTAEGIPRHCLIGQCIVSGQSTAAGFDTHTSGRYITYTDCEGHGFSGGVAVFNIRGLDVTLNNPQVRGGSAIGIWISDAGAYTDMRAKVFGGTIKDLTANRGVRIEGNGVLLAGLSVDNTTAAECIYVQSGKTNMVFRNLHLRNGAGGLACAISLTSTTITNFIFRDIVVEDTTWAIRFNDGGTYTGAGFVEGIQLRNSTLVFPTASTVLAGASFGGLKVKEATNGKQGTAVLVAGTVTVANTSITANSRILLTSQVDGGTPGFLRVSARVNGTSFTITSSNAADTSTVAFEIFEPA